MSHRSIWIRATSELSGRWYMVRKLTCYQVRRVILHCGYYERMYRRRVGHRPDYGNPKTFTEKLAWMRLYDHDPLYTQLVDKLAVRDYVRERVGEDVLIPLCGTWDRADQIDFDALPASFVLKCNHESGFVVLCKDKEKLDQTLVRAQLATRLRMNYYYRYHEWPYKDVKPRIMAEKLLTDENGDDPPDYKIHCFGGEPGYIVTVSDRYREIKRGYYSPTWELFPFSATGVPTKEIPRPKQLERMVEIATALAKGLRYCRVDLYLADGKVYVGEITLLPAAGMLKYRPRSYDAYWGERLKLPTESELEAHDPVASEPSS